MLIVFPRGGVKIVLGDDKFDRCGCFNARAAVPGIFRCSGKLYRGDVSAHGQIAFGFYPPIRHCAAGINRRWNAVESQRKIIACVFAFERDGRAVSPNFSRSRVFDCDGNGILCAVTHSHRAEIHGVHGCGVRGGGNRADVYGDGLGVSAFVRHLDGDFRGFAYASEVWIDVYLIQFGRRNTDAVCISVCRAHDRVGVFSAAAACRKRNRRIGNVTAVNGGGNVVLRLVFQGKRLSELFVRIIFEGYVVGALVPNVDEAVVVFKILFVRHDVSPGRNLLSAVGNKGKRGKRRAVSTRANGSDFCIRSYRATAI